MIQLQMANPSSCVTSINLKSFFKAKTDCTDTKNLGLLFSTASVVMWKYFSHFASQIK